MADVVIALGAWVRVHPDFVRGTNEAGMRLAGATRAADAALWRRSKVGAQVGRLRQVAPVLAVEVAGVDDPEPVLREKARWYLSVGVPVVWLVLPGSREVIVLTGAGEARLGVTDRLPPHPQLPGLESAVSELFIQLAGG